MQLFCAIYWAVVCPIDKSSTFAITY